jgi:hypothetical protein
MDTKSLAGVRAICDQLIRWQAPSGGIDIEACHYHRPPLMRMPNAWHQDMPWIVRTLYAFYDMMTEPIYKAAADGYAVFFLAGMNPDKITAFFGSSLETCYKLYHEHNPLDDSFDDKARHIYQWMLRRRTENGNYFDCGYGWRSDEGIRQKEDTAYSCDLSDVGRGLVAYYQLFGEEETLEHAIGLALYYLNEYRPGTYEGVWSSDIGTWLVGPKPSAHFENLTVRATEAGWGWSTYYGSLFLARLYDLVEDADLRDRIRDRCVTSLRWTFDECQFDDGAVGMAGRDDKWLGMTAVAVLQYLELYRRMMIDEDIQRQYYPKALGALSWLREMSVPDRFPPDGYIPVTGTTRPWPGCNTVWLMALIADGLMGGPALESLGP